MKMAPSSVSEPPTIDSPSPIGFPSSSLSLVISMVVSAPGAISQLAWFAESDADPGFFLGDATGFLVAAEGF
jgi:hypothetical protein